MNHSQPNQPQYYLFNSKILTHIAFWVIYYLVFSLIWANNYGLKASFFLEFILLPARMLAVYATLYWLLPRFLLAKRYIVFLSLLGVLLLSCALIQRIFIYFFYEELLLQSQQSFLDLQALLRSSLLINTTVLLALCIKLVGIVEQLKINKHSRNSIQIKSNRKIHIIDFENIAYIEGLGNYVSYHLVNGQKLQNYSSIKKTLESLPEYFVRIQKSYIANTHHINSFNQESIEINGNSLPRGKDVTDDELVFKG